MISGISGNSNLYKMIASAGSQAGITGTGQSPQDPLNVFDTVDQNGSNAISESEYSLLAEAVQEVTGTELNSSFSDFDQDGDGELSAAELKLVLEEAGFEPPPPPPPPPEQVAAAYRAQTEASDTAQTDAAAQGADASGSGFGPDVLSQVMDYIQNQSGNIDLLA